jgi:trimeric autotransporter adhesin
MTDFTNTLPIVLTETQYVKIQILGNAAMARINAAGSGPPPVGTWQAMYNYIFEQFHPTTGPALQAPAEQQYWFEQAPFINGDEENVPSGYFVRDITAVGFGVAGPSDPTVQAVSNAIGAAIYAGIQNSGTLPAFWQQLTDDIYSALFGSDGSSPYPYNPLPIQSWGGTFYYWNAPFDSTVTTRPLTPALTPPSSSISQYVLGNATANQTFITNYAQAIANTVNHFQTNIPNTGQLVSSFLSGLNGIANLYHSGYEGKIDIVRLVAQTLIDYATLGGSTGVLQSALAQFVQSAVGLYFGSGSTSIAAGGGSNVLVGGQGVGSAGNDTLTAGGANNTFLVNLPLTGSVTQTIVDSLGLGQIVVSSNGQFNILGGTAANPLTPVAGQSNAWQDTAGTQYSFSSSTDQLTISEGYLGAGNEVIVDDFIIGEGAGPDSYTGTSGGFLGIFLPEQASLNASANSGIDPPAPNFIEGSDQSYTLSLDAPSTTAQTFAVTLGGATASDFEVSVGNILEQVGATGTFNVTLAAGETNVSFALVDTTAENGSSDLANGASLTLSASIANQNTLVGGNIQAAPLTFSYVPEASDNAPAPQPADTIVGVLSGGVTTYAGDGGDDYMTGTGASNLFNAQSSGNDSIVGGTQANTINGSNGNSVITLNGTSDTVALGGGYDTVYGGTGHDIIEEGSGDDNISGNGGTDLVVLGNGNSQIYAGAQTSLANAIAAAAGATANGLTGDLIAVGDGSNTVVGGNGNDLIDAGGGNDVIVMGPGSDTFLGGTEVTQAVVGWTTTLASPTSPGGTYTLTETGVSAYAENFANTYPQPYNGSSGVGPGDDTIFGGKGNEFLELGNGNNHVETGNGNDTVLGGMGNDTIILGSGSDTVRGGGGTTYIAGGSGQDNIEGGDGNNTIIAGSGNSTILAANGPNGTLQFAGANLEQNYVFGGSGNDVIQGSAGYDTLIAGTGNTTVTGVSGNENITGGSGNDLLYGGTGNNSIAAGGAGRDSLFAIGSTSSSSNLYGGTGTDLIAGGSGVNILNAGDGGVAGAATTVYASQSDAAATTTLYGGLGVDLLEGGAGSAEIYGGGGGTSLAHTSILAGSGSTTVYGGLGIDIIEGGSGTDELYAGGGGTSTAPTTIGSGTGIDTLFGGAGPSILQDIQSGRDLLVSSTANDTMIGTGGDTLVAGSGSDGMQGNSGAVNFEFNAGFGNATVVSTAGTANIFFGAGDVDTDFSGSIVADSSNKLDLMLSGDGGSIDLESALTGGLSGVSNVGSSSILLPTFLGDVLGGDQTITNIYGGSEIVSLANAESVALTHATGLISSWGTNASLSGTSGTIYSAGTAALISSGGSDAINAAGANATVNGGVADQVTLSGANSLAVAGNGSLVTLAGTHDTVSAASGVSSNITVNDASAVIQIAAGAANNTVNSSVSYTAPTNVAILTLIGSANISATGNAGPDSLTAGTGNDTLVAGSGIDTMTGGNSGNTTFVVNNLNDVVQVESLTNTVQSSISYTLPENVNTLILTGTGALTGTANDANDTLTSNTGVDTLIGGVGNDTFILNNPLDVVQNTAGTATIIYSAAANSFTLPASANALTLSGTAAIHATGNTGNDVITANSGADTLTAGNGADTLISGGGTAVQSLVGGTGNDLFVVNYTGDLVNVGTTHGTDTIQSSVSFSLATNVADLTLIGTGALVGTGNSLANVLTANSGADTLTAGSGIATLNGGAGNDTFVVNSSSDVVKDSFSAASNSLSSSANYTLPTDVNNLIFTGTFALTGTANAANDTLTSNAGADTFVGSTGADTFIVTNAGVVVQDSSGTANAVIASVSYTLPTNVNSLTLSGTAALKGMGNSANDLIIANTGADTLTAGSGADTLISGTSTAIESLVGGSGNDLFVVNFAGDLVSVGGTHGADTIQSSVSYTLPSNVNDLALTGSSNLTGTAISGNNSIIGNAGNDTLKAGSGSDTLIAGVGVDTLVGGSAADTFVIDSASDVLVSVSAAANTVVSSVNYTLATNISTLILDGSANLVGTGNGASNTIRGNNANDTLVAGAGTSSLFGGLGSDLFIINSAADVVSDANYGQKSGIDTIQSSVTFTLPSTINILVLSGTASLSAHGNSNVDELVGNGGADVLTAGNGNTTLQAGTGVATLIGGKGNNTFIIDNTSDVIQESFATHNNILMSSVTYTLPTSINTMILTGSGNLTATGNAGNDSIRGNSGADVLKAGAGTDTLAAGSGTATLVGGSGADTFIVNNTADVIQSASASAQNLLLSSATYSLPTNVNALILTGDANIKATGNAASDTLTAGAGQDTLVAGSGAATLIGGAQNDTFVINSTSDLVQDSVTSSANTVQSTVNDTLVANVNSLLFTGTGALKGTANSGNDTLSSNTGLDTLVGGGGNETFVINNSLDIIQDTSSTAVNVAQSTVNYSLASDVNALLFTGTAALKGTANGGSDTLTSNSGVDTLVGGLGNDTFIVNNLLDVVQDSFAAATNLILSSVNFTLPVNVNALTLTGSAALVATGNTAGHVLTANSGNDTLVAGSGAGTLVGGAGNDTFVVNATGDVVQDTFGTSNNIQSSVNYTLVANVNSLTLTGTSALVATANSANDTLTSNSGVDTLVGGAGHDLFIVNNAGDVIQNATGLDTIESSVNFTAPANITNLMLIGSANLVATGNASADVLTAGAGVDTLVAGTGVATMVGSSGNDTFVVNSSADIIQDTSTTASNVAFSSSTFYSLPSNVDTLTLTGTAALQGVGNNDLNNVLTANSGNDRLTATGFNNTINGGAGIDSLYAGPGQNVIYAGGGGNVLQPTIVHGDATGTSTATQSTIYGGSGEAYLIGGPGSDAIYGGTGASTLIAGSGFDTLYGAAANYEFDSLSGGHALMIAGAGAESLQGFGSDTYVAGSGADLMTADGNNPVTFNFGVGFGQIQIGAQTSHADTLNFASGIEPGSFTAGVATLGGTGGPGQIYDAGLMLQDGASTVDIIGAFGPGVIGNLDFADTGSETLKQLMNADGPGFATFTDENYIEGGQFAVDYISTGNGQDMSGEFVWASGDNDELIGNVIDPYGLVAYGDNDTIIGGSVWASGNNNSIRVAYAMGTATLAGANDTVTDTGNQESFTLEQSSDVIHVGTGTTMDSLDTFFSDTLPTGFTQLTMDSSVGSLAGASNSLGGTLIAGASFDTLTGGAGADTLIAQGASDVLVGGAGSETYVLENSSDTIQFGTAAASLVSVQTAYGYTLTSAANSLMLTGSGYIGAANSANDSLVARGSKETLVGGAGNDTLASQGTALATLIGGSGNDTFEVNNPTIVIVDTATTANNVVLASSSYSLPTNVNTLVIQNTSGTGTANSGNDSLVATGTSDILVAGSGNDTLVAGARSTTFDINSGFANDLILPSQPGDVIKFGAGVTQSSLTFTALTTGSGAPSLVITGSTGAVTVQGGVVPGAISSVNFTGGSNNTIPQLLAPSGRATITGGSGKLIISSTTSDNVAGGTGQDTLATWGNSDTLTAGSGGTVMYAGGVGDSVVGGAGTDTLDSIGASDTLVGGSGNETFVINDASTIVQAAAGGHDTVLSSVSYTAPTNINLLTLLGTSALVATGNANSDTLTGNAGNDTLVAGSGAALLVGRSLADTFVINNAADTLTPLNGSTNDTVSSSLASYTLPASINNLIVGAGDKGTGNVANDYLVGGGSSSLTAGSGNDTLAGHFNDTLTAGSGHDLLVGQGSTVLVSGSGVDTLQSSGGSNSLYINNSSDVVTTLSNNDVLYTSGNYTLSASAPSALVTWNLSGTAALVASNNSNGAVTFIGNAGYDTMIGGAISNTFIDGSGGATEIGSTGGNDTFYVNHAADVVSATSAMNNKVNATVNFTLPTNVNSLNFTGTAALKGTANNGADSLTANSGLDTLVGGSGNDVFIISNSSDVIQDTSSTANNSVTSSVSYSLPVDVNSLTLKASSLTGRGNAGNDSITAWAGGGDTLIAGNGTDTLVSGTSGIDSLVGGTGTDLFIVNSATAVVSEATANTSDSIRSSVSYTLPTNIQYLTLTGSGALAGTGNSLTDLIIGNAGSDTLSGGTGVDVLEGGRTAGSDQIKALNNQAALIGGAAASTLTGGAFKDFYAAGQVSDSITTGATSNVVAVNKGDGTTTLQPTTSATNVLSLGAGIDTESLFFTKTGNNLILTDGVSGDSITFTNWYVGAADQNYSTLQVVEIASANYNSAGSDGLRNKALEAFNFTALVAAYNTAGSPANWALSTAMPTTQLASSSTADYGGDLAYYFGLNGNLTGMDLSAAQSTLTNASFGTATQTIDAFSGISGGGGLHLLVAPPRQFNTPEQRFLGSDDLANAELRSLSPQRGIELRPTTVSLPAGSIAEASAFASSPQGPANREAIEPILRGWGGLGLSSNSDVDFSLQSDTARVIARGKLPELRYGVDPSFSTGEIATAAQAPNTTPINESGDYLRSLTPRFSSPIRDGAPPLMSTIAAPAMSAAMSVDPSWESNASIATSLSSGIQANAGTVGIARGIMPVTSSDIDALLQSTEERPSTSTPPITRWPQELGKNFVDPVNVAWLTMHTSLDDATQTLLGGAEATSNQSDGANDALLSSAPFDQMRRAPDASGLHSPPLHQRAL